MTKFFLKLSGVAIVLAVLISTGCQEDNPIIENPLGPEIQLLSGTGLVSTDVELQENDPFKVQVSADKGDNQLKTLSFTVGTTQPKGAELANYVTKITSAGADVTPQNPLLIVGTAKDGATWEFDLVPYGQAVDQTVTYTFTVEDEVGEKASVSFDITIVAPPGTPLDMELSGVLFNQAGPAGTGGLDLDNGTGTGSANANAEIRDLGVDCTINPATAENWRAKIGSVNGTDMKMVNVAAQPEGFSFENVKTKEAIVSAYDSGVTLADGVSTSATCDETAVTDVSNKVVVGDIFVVKKGTTYYMFIVDEVNAVSGSNGDNYKVSIKY